MKVVRVSDLKYKSEFEAPFYCVLSDESNRREMGCANLAFLNLELLLRRQINIKDEMTAFDIWEANRASLPEDETQAVSFEKAMNFLDTREIFDGFRMLVLNPNGMVPEVFFEIALRRLLQGQVALAMLEVPDKAGDKPILKVNHLAFIHSEEGEVYLDGLKLDLETFIKILYYSPLNTLMFFAKNKVGR